MTGALACPDRAAHAALVPLLAATSVDDAGRAVATLAEGSCPACPHVRLNIETRAMYGTEYRFGRCSCCYALWELDGTDYVIHERGRLVDKLPERP